MIDKIDMRKLPPLRTGDGATPTPPQSCISKSRPVERAAAHSFIKRHVTLGSPKTHIGTSHPPYPRSSLPLLQERRSEYAA